MMVGTAFVRSLGVLAAGLVVGATAVVTMRSPATPDPIATPSPPGPSTPAVDVEAALAYLEAVKPLAQEGGQVVQDGMKRGVVELQKDDGDHEAQAQLAPSWVSRMADLREQWADVAAPPELAGAHARFLEAWDLYRQAAEALVEASTDTERRSEMVDRAIDLGERGDDAWDAAAAVAQNFLVKAGEHPLAWLPTPATDASEG
jgi:hypothetical protein